MEDAARRNLILESIDPSTSRGLEIGALNRPIVKRTDGEVLYVDFTDTPGLRARPYEPPINLDDIVEVDIVWAEQPLAAAVGRPVDYIVASHVIEHVPDLVGWLHDLRGALKTGGALSLAVPDKRYTFDIRRNPSTIGDVIEAYLMGFKRPSLRQVVDNCFYGEVVDAGHAWRQDLSEVELPKIVGDGLALQLAFDQAKVVLAEDRYFDSHCWVFTPQSFLALLDLLAQLKLLPFKLAAFTSTAQNELEFFARLETADPEAVDEIRASIAQFVEPEPANRRLADKLAAHEASLSWRITAPLRALRRLTGR